MGKLLKESVFNKNKLKQKLKNAEISEICCLLGCLCDSSKSIANMVFYAPKLIDKNLFLRVWQPVENQEFCSVDFVLYKESDCFYTSIKEITVMQGDNYGCLYQLVDRETQELYITPYDDFYPCGYSGKLAAMVDHRSYDWPVKEHEWLHEFKSPSHIKKIHIGTESESGDFNGITKKINNHDKSLAYDSVELLPIHEYAGMSIKAPVYKAGKLKIETVSFIPANGWGYDICGSWITVYANYGTPDSLKTMISCFHANSTLIGMDSVFNHFGPDGVIISEFVDVVGGKTAWGDRPDFSDPFVKSWVIESLSRFVSNYHFDFVRLDQSARFEDGNETLFDIGEILPDYVIGKDNIKGTHLFVIAEDEREEIAYTDDSDFICNAGTTISARWDFNFAHGVEYFTKLMSRRVPLSDENLSYLAAEMFDARNTVKYVTSHDEQGNHSGWQIRNHLLECLLIFSRDLIMTWDVDFWHFFRDSWGDVVFDVALLGEKSGLYSQISRTQWNYICKKYSYHVKIMSESAKSLHKKLKLSSEIDLFKYLDMEMLMATIHQRYFSDFDSYEDIITYIKTSIKGFEAAYTDLCYAHNRLMRIMANDKNIYPQERIDEKSKAIQRDLRRKYSWLGMCDSAKDYYEVEPDYGKIVMSRANPLAPDKEQVIGAFNFSPNITNTYEVELSEGVWLAHTISFNESRQVVKRVKAITDAVYSIELLGYEVMIIEKQTDYKKYVPKSFYEFLRPTMAYWSEHPKGVLVDKKMSFVNDDNYNIAGKFYYSDIEVCYGFTKNGKFYVFSEDKSISLLSIMAKDVCSGKYLRFSREQFTTTSKKYGNYYVMQIVVKSETNKSKLGLDKESTPIFYIELPGQVVGIYIP